MADPLASSVLSILAATRARQRRDADRLLAAALQVALWIRQGGGGVRPFDVTVELRGTVGLAPPPDKTAIGGDQAAAGGNGA